mgnify:CR=1 FL=1
MKNRIIGFLTGLISGLFGAGGGMILVPAFSILNKMEEKKTRATSIFCILPLVIISCIIYMKNQYIDWHIGLKSAAGGIIGGMIGTILLKKLNNQILKILFVIFLIYVSIRMVI